MWTNQIKSNLKYSDRDILMEDIWYGWVRLAKIKNLALSHFFASKIYKCLIGSWTSHISPRPAWCCCVMSGGRDIAGGGGGIDNIDRGGQKTIGGRQEGNHRGRLLLLPFIGLPLFFPELHMTPHPHLGPPCSSFKHSFKRLRVHHGPEMHLWGICHHQCLITQSNGSFVSFTICPLNVD